MMVVPFYVCAFLMLQYAREAAGGRFGVWVKVTIRHRQFSGMLQNSDKLPLAGLASYYVEEDMNERKFEKDVQLLQAVQGHIFCRYVFCNFVSGCCAYNPTCSQVCHIDTYI